MKKIIALVFSLFLFTLGASAKGKHPYEGKKIHAHKMMHHKKAHSLKKDCCMYKPTKQQVRHMRKKSMVSKKMAYKHAAPKMIKDRKFQKYPSHRH